VLISIRLPTAESNSAHASPINAVGSATSMQTSEPSKVIHTGVVSSHPMSCRESPS